VLQNNTLWRARVWDLDHEVYIGHFETPKLAAQAYDKASMRYVGIKHHTATRAGTQASSA
jgi:hypothetical protein